MLHWAVDRAGQYLSILVIPQYKSKAIHLYLHVIQCSNAITISVCFHLDYNKIFDVSGKILIF